MKILMVCLGNICRSPLAHGIVEHLVTEQGLDWTVDSAGTSNWHEGQAPDHRTINVANINGIDISKQRAQHFTATLFDQYDRIYAMDQQNYKDILALAETEEQRNKVSLFLPDKADVQDPYFDDKLFDPVYAVIKKRSQELIEELKTL